MLKRSGIDRIAAETATDCRRQRARQSAHHGGDRLRAAALRSVSIQSRDAFVAVRRTDWPRKGNRLRPRSRRDWHDPPRHRPHGGRVRPQPLRSERRRRGPVVYRGSRSLGSSAQLIWDLVALNSTPSLALHKEPEIAVGTMGIGLDFGGFGLDALQAGDIGRILSAFPRLKMKDQIQRGVLSAW